MPHTDLPLEELRRYDPQLPAPDDLGEFWAATLEEAAAWPLDASWTRGSTTTAACTPTPCGRSRCCGTTRTSTATGSP